MHLKSKKSLFPLFNLRLSILLSRRHIYSVQMMRRQFKKYEIGRLNKGKNYFLFFFEVGFNFFIFDFLVLCMLKQHAEEICAYVHKIIIIR